MKGDKEAQAKFVLRKVEKLRSGDSVVNHGILESIRSAITLRDTRPRFILTFKESRFIVDEGKWFFIEVFEVPANGYVPKFDGNPATRERAKAVRGVTIE